MLDSEGMPLGVMFVAPPGEDLALMKAAQEFENAIGCIEPPKFT